MKTKIEQMTELMSACGVSEQTIAEAAHEATIALGRQMALVPVVDHAVKFDQFWAAKPDRDGSNPKKPAREKFLRLCKAGKNPDMIIAAVARLSDHHRARGSYGTCYVPQMVTWLNQARFEDVEPPPPNSGPSLLDLAVGRF